MSLELGYYKHFKGNQYEVFDFAKHSETGEEFVVYRPCYGNKKTWIRPLSMFGETIVRDGKSIKRFEFLGPKVTP